jgi:hypothetical protein
VQFIEALAEKQIGNLLDNGEGVRDAARPEGVPHPVNL